MRSPLDAIPTLAVLLLLAPPASALQTIRWDQADQFDGREVTVEGYVMGVVCGDRRCTLAFDPMFKRFAAVVKASRFGVFPPSELKRAYTGRQVKVTGTIRVVDGRPEMALMNADDLVLVETAKPAAAKEEEPPSDAGERTQQHDELIQRLDELIGRVVALDDRVVALEQRLDVVLAQLEQQSNQLAALDVEPPEPADPTWGEPQPRPGYESLRSLKRGMSTAQVERLVGPPLRVQSTGDGWVIWDYGYGRSISFDRRGKANSLVGFPKP